MRGKGEKQEPWLLIKEQRRRGAAARGLRRRRGDARQRADRPRRRPPAATRPTAARPSPRASEPEPPARPPRRSAARPRCPPAPRAAARHAGRSAPPAGRTTGSTRSSSTATACWPASTATRCGASRATATTGRRKLPALAKALREAAHALGLARRRDRGRRRERRARLPGAAERLRQRRARPTSSYWLFDVPFLDGHDLRALPVEERRARAARSCWARSRRPACGFSEAFDAAPRELLASAAQLGFEGIIGKRKDSAYVSRRSPDWIKLKSQRRQEFVIGGYTDPKGSRTGFGSLLLGVHDDEGALQYCGNVGTGFDAGRLADIKAKLDKLATRRVPLRRSGPPASRRTGSSRSWWPRCRSANGRATAASATPCSRACAATSRPAASGARQAAAPAAASRAGSQRSEPPQPTTLRITHPERVIDQHSGATKGELVAYYDQVARADAAAPEGPAGRAGARARGHRRRAVLPEACRARARCRA